MLCMQAALQAAFTSNAVFAIAAEGHICMCLGKVQVVPLPVAQSRLARCMILYLIMNDQSPTF